jgi:hypothetical protein
MKTTFRDIAVPRLHVANGHCTGQLIWLVAMDLVKAQKFEKLPKKCKLYCVEFKCLSHTHTHTHTHTYTGYINTYRDGHNIYAWIIHICMYTNEKYIYTISWLHFTLVIFTGIHVWLALVLHLNLLKSVYVDRTWLFGPNHWKCLTFDQLIRSCRISR